MPELRFALDLRYPDYDTKGHVNNAVYLTYFEIARAKAWLAIGGDPDFPFVVAEARISYRSQARIGEPLDIQIWTPEVRTKSWVWRYRITDPRDDRLVAEGETVQVMFDYVARRSIEVPPDLRAKLMSLGAPAEAGTSP